MLRLIVLSCIALISGCTAEIQNTSGRAYLAAGAINDPEIASRAAYEPTLSLPARIGIVRLVYGKITTIPTRELGLYTAGLPEGIGSITQLGPLEAQLSDSRGYSRMDQKRIRQLAASRHLDLVLIVSLEPGNNTAEALVIDVRSGYPYASIETSAEGRGIRNFWGGRVRNQGRLKRATFRLAQKLKPELEVMAGRLTNAADN